MLTSGRAREQAGELAARCRYVELSTRAGFQKAFLQHIGFTNSRGPHRDHAPEF
jgi:hypothetical protein